MPIRIALDGNEANTVNRVGSNVYAFELLSAMEKLTRTDENYSFTVLLRKPPIAELPTPRVGWNYRVVKPTFLWTQIGLPIHLFLHKKNYDLLFTPGHYAPRLSSIPYISSVMDLAFLIYPEQFNKSDYIQLKDWTSYSVKHAQKIVAISQTTKRDVIKKYKRKSDDIAVIYPASKPSVQSDLVVSEKFFKKNNIRSPYFLFIGTFQPRKNLIRLVEAFEEICRRSTTKPYKLSRPPQLVLAGKIGWLADDILERIKASPFYEYIVLPGYVPDEIKPILYNQAVASVLVGLYEGFGIPPLESLQYGCIPIVANNSSLPEVVGDAGVLVNPFSSGDIAVGLEKVLLLNAKQKAQLRKKGRDQAKKFSWEKSAEQVLELLTKVTKKDV